MKSWRKRGSIRRRWLRSRPEVATGFQRVAQNFIARGIARQFYSTWPIIRWLLNGKGDEQP